MRDSLGKESASDTIEVFPGNTPPEPVIESPAEGTTFRVRQDFTATGSATDAEDDADPDSATAPAVEWEVRRYHNGNHYHPWASGTGEDVTFSGPAPEELISTDPTKHYPEIRLTATR